MIQFISSQIKVDINDKTGQINVLDLATRINWHTNISVVSCSVWDIASERACSLLPEHWLITPLDNGLKFIAEQFGLELSVYYQLNDNELTVKIPFGDIKEINNNFRLLNFTPLFQMGIVENGSDGYLLIPSHSGVICRFDKTVTRSYNSHVYMEQSQWEDFTSMPIFGAVHNNSAFIGIISSGEYDGSIISEVCQGTEKLNSVYPLFNFRYCKIDKPDKTDREVKYTFLSGRDANYCGMAKTYRKYLINCRKIVPLKERIFNNPALKYYVESYNEIRLAVGGNKKRQPDGKGKYVPVGTIANTEQIIREMHAIGIEKALVMFEYWTLEGGDGVYPTKLPVDPRLGSNEDLSRLLKINHDLGYRSTNWDNYTDCYKSSPEWDEKLIMLDRDGQLRCGGIWNGGQAYLACPAQMTDFAQRDLMAQQELGFDGIWYIDAMVQPPRICYNQAHGHTATRREYVEGLKKITKIATGIFGGCTIENSIDSMADAIDGIAQICIIDKRFDTTDLGKYFADEFVPFYQITFHGLLVYHICSLPHMVASFGNVKTGILKDIELGAAPRADLSYGDMNGRCYKNWLTWMKKQYDWHYKTTKDLLYEFIEDHRETKPGVFCTEYSSGARVIVDYNNQVAEYCNPNGKREILCLRN